MPSISPRIPYELIDDIIRDFIQDGDKTSASTIALVSRSYRHLAHVPRFSRITIYPHRNRFFRLEVLAGLLNDNVWPPHEGLHRYIKFVQLYVDGPVMIRRGTQLLFDPDNESVITSILRGVFRASQGNSPSETRSLTIATDVASRHTNLDQRKIGVPFTNISPDVISVIQDIYHNSCMTDLCLESIWDVPRSIVSSPQITHLHLDHVLISIDDVEGICDTPLRNLKSLFFAESPSFIDLILEWKTKYTSLFTLEKLEIWVDENEKAQTIFRFDAEVDTLVINTCEMVDILPYASEYRKYVVHKRLEINLGKWFMPFKKFFIGIEEIDKLEMPLFYTISRFLPAVLPPVLRINFEIKIDWHHPFAPTRDALEELYMTEIYDPSLLCSLERSKLSRNILVEINMAVSIFLNESAEGNGKKECEEYTRRLFTNLITLDWVTFNIIINMP